MLKLLFFARIKEELNCAGLDIDWDESIGTLAKLEAHLIALHGDNWAQVLGQDNIIRAVNQTVVEAGASLEDGDEVAFFPPVTGG